ncbi:MAG: hypothetical protein ABSC64_20235 [Candidatus Korobacteraceae bacterium]
MNIEQFIAEFEAEGGRLQVRDGLLKCKLPKKVRGRLLAMLRPRRAEVFQFLLLQGPPVPIPPCCTCREKPYPHLTHADEADAGDATEDLIGAPAVRPPS